jgi:multidrug efflux pump subunit AcrA (membrane-fusion protein)
MKWTNRTVTWVGAGVLASAVGLGVAFLGGAGCSNGDSAARVQPGKTSAPSAGDTGQPVRVKVVRPRVSTPQPSHIEPYEKTDIHAKVSGYLERIGPALGPDGKPILEKDGQPRPLDIGDRVTKGQVLTELSVPEMKQEVVQKAALVEKARSEVGQATAAVQAAKALVAQHDADVLYHEVEHKRYLDLFKQNAVDGQVVDKEEKLLRRAQATVVTAQKNVQVKEADEKAAEARLKVAEADLKYMEIMVDYATIRAPYDGIITRRLLDTGTFVQSAASGKPSPLFTVVRVDPLRIVADVPETEAAWVRIGQKASFLHQGQPLTGTVVRFADALDSGTRTMRTEIELDAPVTTLRPGMFSAVVFPMTLPTTALVAGAKPSVLCVEDGKVKRREIEIGHDDGVHVQITGRLSTDAQVIADGKASVREGQAVEVAK